jgi:hypothetical protein
MNNRKLLLTWIIAGLTTVVILTALVFNLSHTNSASAQMMQHRQGMTGPSVAQQWQPILGYSSSGSSFVENVRVTGISIMADNEVTVSLMYTGMAKTPGVVLVANTNPMEMMSSMHGSTMGGNMMRMQEISGNNNMMPGLGGFGPKWNATTTTTGMTDGPLMSSGAMLNSTAMMPQMQIGSNAIDAGWKTGTFKVKLEGDGSAYDSGHIMVMVFPFTR